MANGDTIIFSTNHKKLLSTLHDYTHHEELNMARDKAQAAAAMRVRMGRLRSGIPGSAPNSTPTGRGGGRGE
jgi:hypothetical protein